ncbi:MAG: LacI family DNA-binding transcriptional regulator [Actinobacteria bacterium]|nr:LacI family DNA-binding transcriptional regulator [Actinomycetota bacterium]
MLTAMNERPATIRDVAARAGVSKSLVSRVLRGEPNVSAERRAMVQAAMTELDYRPNTIARGLSEARSGTVGVVLNDLRNPWFVTLLEGLTTTLDAVGIAPLLADSHLDTRVGRDTVETLLSHRVDGLVVVGTTEAGAAVERAARTVPVVLAGTLEPDLPRIDIAADDDDAGARLATRHLLDLGHRRVGHLAGSGIVGALRRAAFEAAMAGAGLADLAMVEVAGMTEEGGYAAAARLLDRPQRPTAILAFNDVTCVGALSAADDRHLVVPHDLSLVGYDDTYLARIRHLSLTSVDNGNFAVGSQAAKFLLQRIQRPDLPQRVYLHPPTLSIRRSTAGPPQR